MFYLFTLSLWYVFPIGQVTEEDGYTLFHVLFLFRGVSGHRGEEGRGFAANILTMAFLKTFYFAPISYFFKKSDCCFTSIGGKGQLPPAPPPPPPPPPSHTPLQLYTFMFQVRFICVLLLSCFGPITVSVFRPIRTQL